MKRIKSIIIFCVIFSSAITFAQHKVSFPHIAEMTPNAASICQYQDIPVSYYSGIPQINLPLYEIDIDGFKLPITMNYHASGIKVSQEASWVGLGWSLEIGGSISRSVKNVDDFLQSRIDVEHPYFEKGYYYAPEITDTSLRVDNNLTLIYPNTYEFRSDPTSAGFSESFFNLGAYTLMQIYDSEPDIFFYNLPSMSGKFIFDKSHKAVLFNKEHNLEVRPYYNRNLGKTFFVLKDAEGNTYIFRDVETTKVYRQKGYLNRNGTDRNVYDDTPNDYIGWHESIFEEPEPGPATPYELISNWCLTEIITNTNRHIYFTYEHEEQFMPTQESCELSHFATINGPTPGASRLDYFKSKNINNALRLARIDYDYGHIDFIASTRYDINSSISGRAKKLDQISIYDSNSNLIRYFSFNYSYFNQEHEDDNFCNVFLRLKLDSVTDSQIGKPYTFSYDESHALPAKNFYITKPHLSTSRKFVLHSQELSLHSFNALAELLLAMLRMY